MIELSIVISESLARTRIAITGSTGFVGTALVERLLRSIPDCELVLLIRDGKRTPAARRAQREILKNDAFDRLREQYGDDFDTEVAGRITTIAGDVTRDGLGLSDTDRALFASCSTVIHSAAAVSFDSLEAVRSSKAPNSTVDTMSCSSGTRKVRIEASASIWYRNQPPPPSTIPIRPHCHRGRFFFSIFLSIVMRVL